MNDLTAGQVTAFFDRVASDWDEMRLVYYDEAVIEHLAAAADLDATMTVADVGTGTGFVAAGLAGRVIGIDDSAGMLAVAEKNLNELGASNVELRRGDIGSLPPPRRLGRRRCGQHGSAPRHRPGRDAARDGPHRAPGRDRRDLRRGHPPVRVDARGAPRRLARLQRRASRRVLRRRRPRRAEPRVSSAASDTCSPRPRSRSPPSTSSPPMPGSPITAADHARAALEQVCARGDLVRARELYAEDFVDHVNALEFHGQDGIAKSVALYRAVFPDLQLRVEDQTVDGDRVTSRWTLHGTHKGRAVTLPGITISRFENGKIAEDWTVSDNVELLRRLGLRRAFALAARHLAGRL